MSVVFRLGNEKDSKYLPFCTVVAPYWQLQLFKNQVEPQNYSTGGTFLPLRPQGIKLTFFFNCWFFGCFFFPERNPPRWHQNTAETTKEGSHKASRLPKRTEERGSLAAGSPSHALPRGRPCEGCSCERCTWRCQLCGGSARH